MNDDDRAVTPPSPCGISARPVVDRAAWAVIAAATVVYGALNHYRLAHFYPLEWDLAIFAQGLSRLSSLAAPFVSVRGMNLFGEHATFVHLALVPLDAALGGLLGPHLLVLVQSAALATAAALLYRLARRELPAAPALLVLAACLLHPALQHTWLEYYSPINLSIPCLVGAYVAVRDGRERAALVWSGLALLTIENVVLSVASLGAYAALRGRRRLGGVLALGAGAYLVLLMTAVFPWLAPGGYVYGDRLYGDFAPDLPSALVYLARPDHLWGRIAQPANGPYLVGLLAPLAFLPLFAPAPLLVAVQLPLNMVSSWPYAHDIRYHYVAPILPFVFVALVHAMAAAWRTRGRWPACAALCAGALIGQASFASPWLYPRDSLGWWRGRASDSQQRLELERLLSLVPRDASVSAHYRFLPHLARRDELYMFPSLGGEGAPDLVLVDVPDASVREPERRAWQALSERCPEIARTSRDTVLLQCRERLTPPPAWTASPCTQIRGFARSACSP